MLGGTGSSNCCVVSPDLVQLVDCVVPSPLGSCSCSCAFFQVRCLVLRQKFGLHLTFWLFCRASRAGACVGVGGTARVGLTQAMQCRPFICTHVCAPSP